ncbi:hypothetical protein TNCV_10421 [Trichonephila clavipes]|nr:hypothetical protein TNCV_10421 [Trichonephila clavipes]
MIQNDRRVTLREILLELGSSADTWLNGQGPDFYQDGLSKWIFICTRPAAGIHDYDTSATDGPLSQVTRTAPKLASLSPSYHTMQTGGLCALKDLTYINPSTLRVFSGPRPRTKLLGYHGHNA